MRFLETSRHLTVRPSPTAAVNRTARRTRSTILPADANNGTATMSETEKLIELVKERTFLYDMNDPEYKNRAKRLATWKLIAEEMGSGNADIWSAKWKGLKDNYAKFKKSTEPPYSEHYKKYKKWPWSEHVRFLDECNFTSCRRVRLQPGTAKNTSNTIVDANPEESNDAEQEVIENKRKKKRSITEQSEEDQVNYKIKKNNKPPPDGVDQFFLSYAQSFKKLPSRMQIMLKLEIATLFSRYELQANGVNPDSVDSIPRIVPHPVKSEFDFSFDIDE